MRCKNPIPVLLALLGLAVSLPASAVVIQFDPADIDAALGGAFGIDVVVSGLHDPQAGDEIISAFDLDVLYDASILSATDVAFGAALGLPGLDAFTGSFLSPGRIDFAAVSFLNNSELFAIQADSFVLARLLFDAVGLGVATLSFDALTAPGANLVGSDPFASLNVTRLGSAQVNVVPSASVPEPGSLALLAFAAAGFAMMRRLSRRRARPAREIIAWAAP